MLGPLIPWLLVAALVVGAGGYVKGRADGAEIASAEHLKHEELIRQASEAAQVAAATEIAKLEVKRVTIKQRVEKETREVPVYRDCHHSGPGLRIVNTALTNGTLSAGDSELPREPGAAAGR